ncbi:MAG: hypothetical protein K1X67_00895 [Fimbriimonadaceae bacterium]|nr:hypothetical protein [Fimbriimonadaceae bacterium]
MATTTQSEMLQYALDQAKFQVGKVFEGVSDTGWTTKSCDVAMSPAATAEHLCEVYTAFKTMAAGGDHEWGNYSSGLTERTAVLDLMNKLREEAVAIALSSDEYWKAAFEYIILHDTYHVGQMALNRMTADPSWDPYSIYGH